MEDEPSDDEVLAAVYLHGYIAKAPDGTISLEYFEPRSAEEKEAQAALVRLLRNSHWKPLRAEIAMALAGLFDAEHSLQTREVVIRPRAGGTQPNPTIDIMIARELARAVIDGVKLESAVEDAKKRFQVSRATVLRAWAKHKDFWMKVEKAADRDDSRK
jgi:hypothetical protein